MWLVVYVSTFHWYTGGNEGQVLEISFSLFLFNDEVQIKCVGFGNIYLQLKEYFFPLFKMLHMSISEPLNEKNGEDEGRLRDAKKK